MAGRVWTDEQKAKLSATLRAKRKAKRHKRLTPTKRALKAARFRATMAAKRAQRAVDASKDFAPKDEIYSPRTQQTFAAVVAEATAERKLELIRMILDL